MTEHERPEQTAGQLYAGVARANITPPVGIEMGGCRARLGVSVSQGVLDELCGTAVVLGRSETELALVSCDLVAIYDDLAASVRHQVTERTGIPGDHVMIGASHTHSGPGYGGIWAASAMARKYKENLASLLAGAVAAARIKMQPARAIAGKGQVHANVSRRKRLPDGSMVLDVNPEGAVDPGVGVIRIDDLNGNPLALVVNYAAHPVCLRANNLLISADWVGFMRSSVEYLVGAPVLFLQGASGDLIPVERGNQIMARRVGLRVASEVLRIFSTIQTTARLVLEGDPSDYDHVQGERLVVAADPVDDALLGVRRTFVSMPLEPPVHRDKVEDLVATWAEVLGRLERAGEDPGQSSVAQFYRDWFEQELQALKSEGRPATFPAEMQALRIGDAALVTFPAEVFTEIGLAVKERSPFPVTMFVSLANGGSLPYVPTEEAFTLGGYEPQRAREGAEMLSGLAPTAGATIVEVAATLLHSLWSD